MVKENKLFKQNKDQVLQVITLRPPAGKRHIQGETHWTAPSLQPLYLAHIAVGVGSWLLFTWLIFPISTAVCI